MHLPHNHRRTIFLEGQQHQSEFPREIGEAGYFVSVDNAKSWLITQQCKSIEKSSFPGLLLKLQHGLRLTGKPKRMPKAPLQTGSIMCSVNKEIC